MNKMMDSNISKKNKNTKPLSSPFLKKYYFSSLFSIRTIILLVLYIPLCKYTLFNAVSSDGYDDFIFLNILGPIQGTLSMISFFIFSLFQIVPIFIISSFYQKQMQDSKDLIHIRVSKFHAVEKMLDLTVYSFLIVYIIYSVIVSIGLFFFTSGGVTPQLSAEYSYYLEICGIDKLPFGSICLLYEFNRFIELLCIYYIVKITYRLFKNTTPGFVLIFFLFFGSILDLVPMRFIPIGASYLGRYIHIVMGKMGTDITFYPFLNYYFSTLLLVIWFIILMLINYVLQNRRK